MQLSLHREKSNSHKLVLMFNVDHHVDAAVAAKNPTAMLVDITVEDTTRKD